jgi:NSS family neurotransmitter:Na+ symporter
VYFLGERTLFDTLDFITTNIMLPLGGLLMSVFVAWVMSAELRDQQLQLSPLWLKLFLFDLKWIAPVAIMIVFASNLVESNSTYLLIALTLLIYVFYIWNSQNKNR